jgi:hypothetical protein
MTTTPQWKKNFLGILEKREEIEMNNYKNIIQICKYLQY